MQDLVNTLNIARKGRGDYTVLEGFHALKHAIRFGADVTEIYVSDETRLAELGDTVSDSFVLETIKKNAITLSATDFEVIAPQAARTGVVAVAKKKTEDVTSFFEDFSGHIVVLENPHDLDNVGAVVRVLAARGSAALVVTGEVNPWHARALRAGAGLQFALPLFQMSMSDVLTHGTKRKIIACTDEGESMYKWDAKGDEILIFGTEREGITAELRKKADAKMAIPMRKGVSSMNLATSVSAIVFRQSV